jgi:hypothetical protein
LGSNWLGFGFCVAFEVNNLAANSGSFPFALPHPFYLSFESELKEERFDMPLSLELDKIDGSKHLWIIYISGQVSLFAVLEVSLRFLHKYISQLTMLQWQKLYQQFQSQYKVFAIIFVYDLIEM